MTTARDHYDRRVAAGEDAGWLAPVPFVSHGAPFRVRANDARVLAAVTARLPPGSRPCASGAAGPTFSLHVAPPDSGGHHVLYGGGRRLAASPAVDDLLSRLESELHFVVATGARGYLFVHAGAVVHAGRGLLVPGRSFSGKSELTAALVAAGATYYSDEYAVLDAQGLLHPYRKRISLRGTAEGSAQADVLVASPRGVVPVPVGLVVVTRYVRGASWQPRRLARSEAMAALLQNTVLARVRPHAAMTTLARVASRVSAVAGDRGEAEETAAALLAAGEVLGRPHTAV